MVTTNALAVKRKIYEALKADPRLSSATVTMGFVRDIPRVWVFLGDIIWESEDWAALGNRRREEIFSIDVVFNVQAHGGTSEEAEAQVFDLYQAFEEILRSDPTLGGLVTQAGAVPRDEKVFPSTGFHEAQLASTVYCKARK